MKVNFIIFTDGSVRRFDGKVASAYGVVVLDCRTKKYTQFGDRLKTNSIVYAEAWAVYRGLQYINRICHDATSKPTVLVVTDSKLNVSIFTEYIPHRWDLSNWGEWRKTDGSYVKNQDIYRDTVELIHDNHMFVKFLHINSHTSNIDWEMIRMKASDIGIDLKKGVCKMFVDMNQRADQLAAGITLEMKNKKRGIRENESTGKRRIGFPAALRGS